MTTFTTSNECREKRGQTMPQNMSHLSSLHRRKHCNVERMIKTTPPARPRHGFFYASNPYVPHDAS